MRLEDGRRERSRRFLSDSDWRLLVIGLAAIAIGGSVLLYFSTSLADAVSHRLMDQTRVAAVSD